MKQMALFKTKQVREFGGSLLKGKRKRRRPLDTKKPIHLVLKAANGFHLLKNNALVGRLTHTYAKRFGVRIYGLGIHADHVHLNIKIPTACSYRKWIRAVTGQLSLQIPGLKWRLRPYTRIVAWGKAFRAVQNYIAFNCHEGDFILKAHERIERWQGEILGGWWEAKKSKNRQKPQHEWRSSI